MTSSDVCVCVRACAHVHLRTHVYLLCVILLCIQSVLHVLGICSTFTVAVSLGT